MGDPITASHSAEARAPVPSQGEPPPAKVSPAFAPWNGKWQQIQGPADKVGYVDHFRVCAIKYRYRNYDELFRCLDLFEAKVQAGDSRVGRRPADVERLRRAAPVFTGWLRASAYADLGEPVLALKWAESAWAALPPTLQSVSQSDIHVGIGELLKKRDHSADDLCAEATTIGGKPGFFDVNANPADWGRENPAGLKMDCATIGMALAAQRALLFQRLGDGAKATAALEQLLQWASLSLPGSLMVNRDYIYRDQVRLMSLGPLYAMGRYSEVVKAYDDAAASLGGQRHFAQFLDALQWLTVIDKVALAGLQPLVNDPRVFSVALEDASNGLIYAQSLARLGKRDQARAMLDTLLAMPELRAMGNLYWATLYERGQIARREGQRADAERLLRQSIAAIESVRGTIAFEGARIGFAGDKQAVYAALVECLAEQGNWQDVFLVAERAKARSLVDLLAQQRMFEPPAATDAKVRALLAQAARVDDATLQSSEDGVRGVKLVADSRQELASAAPESASLVAVQGVSIATIGAHLGADESLVDYYGAGEDLYALVLNGTQVTGFRLSAKGLDAEVRGFREAIERRDPGTAQRGRQLYDRLLRPLAAALAGRRLAISPHGVLHYLPFTALMDGDQYLLDRFSVRLLPSASTLAYLKSDHPAKAGTLLALGNPDLANSAYDLPNAQVEAVNIAALFPDSRALVRAEASRTAVRELGNGFAMIHFATHGKFNPDTPLASGLYLAKGSDPSGLLTVSDLYTLRFDTDLVTLSACETALGTVANGDDVIGLTRGFLYAGARSIVASLWEVDDAATEQLMLSFYRHLKDSDKREALRLAQVETRARYPEPVYWAAFQIVGQAQ